MSGTTGACGEYTTMFVMPYAAIKCYMNHKLAFASVTFTCMVVLIVAILQVQLYVIFTVGLLICECQHYPCCVAAMQAYCSCMPCAASASRTVGAAVHICAESCRLLSKSVAEGK
jgi:hypothetical protein